MHPGPAIRRLRREREMRLQELATEVERQLGKPVNTGNLSRLERELQGYSNEIIQAIARALKVEVSQLFQPPSSLPVRVGVVRDKSDLVEVTSITHSAGAVATYSIPVLEIEGGMSTGGRFQPEYDTIVGKMEVNPEWLRTRLPKVTSPKNLRVITGYGDSMQPTYYDGDILLVDVGVAELRLDAAYVFSLAGGNPVEREIFIKTLQRLPGGAVKVISDNKKYPEYVLDENSRRQMEIIGRVVWVWNGRKL